MCRDHTLTPLWSKLIAPLSLTLTPPSLPLPDSFPIRDGNRPFFVTIMRQKQPKVWDAIDYWIEGWGLPLLDPSSSVGNNLDLWRQVVDLWRGKLPNCFNDVNDIKHTAENEKKMQWNAKHRWENSARRGRLSGKLTDKILSGSVPEKITRYN